MSSYEFALFLHLFFVVLSFSIAGILHAAMFELKAARTVGQARPAIVRVAKLEPLFPLSALGIFLAGAYMVHEIWEWSDAWIVGSIVGFLIMEGLGATVLKRATKDVSDSLEGKSDDAALDGAAARFGSNTALWATAHLGTGLAIGIIFLMTVKPDALGTILTLVLVPILSIASALPFVEKSEATQA